MDESVNFKEALKGLNIQEQIIYYKDYYDSIIQCDDYYRKMFPDWDGVFNTRCKLHDEERGTSLLYSKQMNILTCKGKCHASFRAVYFHYAYQKKFNPNFSTLDALKELWKMFTTSPTDKNNKFVQAYKELPYPKIYTESIPMPEPDGRITLAIGEELTEVDTSIKGSVILTDNLSLSCKILNIFLSEKNTSRKYK